MLKAQILSWEAVAPYNSYDSILEIPNGNNSYQNAWLTLQLRVKLNFVDSKNPLPGLTVFQGGIWYARDSVGYLFPLMDWPSHLTARFQSEFAERAEKTWNSQFMLITPRNYSGFGLSVFCKRRHCAAKRALPLSNVVDFWHGSAPQHITGGGTNARRGSTSND